MIHIVIPVDFSEASKNAMEYAVMMSKDWKAVKLTFFHSIADAFAEQMHAAEEHKKKAQEKIALLMEELSEIHPDGDYNVMVNADCMIDNIKHISDTAPIDMVIMGISKKGRLTQHLMGSFSLAVAHDIDIPVLIVPHDFKYTAPKKIL